MLETGDFKLSSGRKSEFKIECDSLTDTDWATAAKIIGEKTLFGYVYGVPTGGLKFAEHLQKYKKEGHKRVLIVDDVLTTGGSMNRLRDKLSQHHSFYDFMGVVLFARGDCPDWVTAIFKTEWI